MVKEVGLIATDVLIGNTHIGCYGQRQNRDFAARRCLACRIVYHPNEGEVKV